MKYPFKKPACKDLPVSEEATWEFRELFKGSAVLTKSRGGEVATAGAALYEEIQLLPTHAQSLCIAGGFIVSYSVSTQHCS